MLIQSLRPQTFSQVVGNSLNNKILMALAHNQDKAPSTILLQGHFGSGKALDVESIIPTPTGNKRAVDIVQGDYLFDQNGNQTQVQAVFPQGKLDSYKVKFEDGRVVYCNSEHIWTVYNRKTNSLVNRTLQEIIDYKDRTHAEVRIPLCKPIDYPDAELPITPYSLGLLLTNVVYQCETLLYPNKSDKFVSIIEKENPQYWWNVYTNKDYIFPSTLEGTPISPQVFYGDLYTSIVENKEIPNIYLKSSINQRWELLQGILDGCATISDDNNVFCYLSSEELLRSVVSLSYGLGLVVSVIPDRKNPTLLYKSNRSLLTKLFKLKKLPDTSYNHGKEEAKIDSLRIISIEKEEEQREMVCFLVDNPDHLFLCNDYIVTHNTTSARLFAKALNCRNLRDNDICGKCDICKSDLNSVPWYNEFDSSMLNTDTIREMRDILLTTTRGYNKVIVIDETHLLSKTALSALLKVFEESPKGIFYLLATTDPEKLLPTIRSRSLELVFTTKTTDEVKKDIEKHSKELGLNLSDSTISFIATRSKGIMRNAHMLLDKVNILGEEEFLKSDITTIKPMYDYIVSILKSDRSGVLEAVSELSRLPVTYLKEDWQEFFLSLIKASIDPSTTKEDKIQKLISVIPKQNIVTLVRTCTQDWVIKSFQSSTQAQAAMLAIFQQISK